MYLNIVSVLLTSVYVAYRGMLRLQNICPETYTNQKIVTLQWEARSSDLAPIEHVWDILGRNVRFNHDVRPCFQMTTVLHLEWAEVPPPQNDIRAIICSMRHRCTACMRANGGHTSNLTFCDIQK